MTQQPPVVPWRDKQNDAAFVLMLDLKKLESDSIKRMDDQKGEMRAVLGIMKETLAKNIASVQHANKLSNKNTKLINALQAEAQIMRQEIQELRDAIAYLPMVETNPLDPSEKSFFKEASDDFANPDATRVVIHK